MPKVCPSRYEQSTLLNSTDKMSEVSLRTMRLAYSAKFLICRILLLNSFVIFLWRKASSISNFYIPVAYDHDPDTML